LFNFDVPYVLKAIKKQDMEADEVDHGQSPIPMWEI